MADDLRLRVVASSIEGKGMVKLDCDSFGALRLADGTPVIVAYGAKSLELIARLDTFYSPATARMMKSDMSELRVEDGMEVSVSRKGGKPEPEPKPARKAKGKGKKAKAGKPGRPRKKGGSRAASLDKF